MRTPIKVLLVEDSPEDAELIMAQLTRDGFDPKWTRVCTETDFLAAVKKRPDIILSDYSMPQFGGLKAARLTNEGRLNIPFILISGTVGEEVAVEAMKLGAADYLMKDRIVRLGSAVRRALEQKLMEAERRRTAEELQWKTTVLEAQLESSPDGILVMNSEGEMILKNGRMDEIWNNPRLVDVTKRNSEQNAFDPALVKNPKEFIEKVAYLVAYPEATSHDMIELIDGTVLDRYSAPVRGPVDGYHGRIWLFRDITERRRMESQFQQAQKMESIGMLAGGIAHDFNNILTAIFGNLYLAKSEMAGNPELAEALENISLASKRASELVNQILTFSRQNKQERAPVKPHRVVMEALKLLRASIPASIQIETDLPEMPVILANATSVHQVIMNLGTNAWHAMRDQPGILKVELTVIEADPDFASLHPALRAGRYVRVAVSDTGHGMDTATIERIFNPFFTTKPVGEGTGLGLAVVLGIMQSHDGAIKVYSEPGMGTTFHLYFPVFETESIVTEDGELPIPNGRGESILFVDDESVLVNVGKKMLERLGYAVTAKTSAMDAVAAVRDQPDAFKLVVTDLTMPEMDGIKLGRQLLQIQPGLPILLATGYSGRMTDESVRELGFRGLLVKPTTARALGEAVDRALHGG